MSVPFVADLEGEMENLAVEGSFSVAAGGSKYRDGKVDHWSTQTVLVKEESDGVKLAETERQEMNGITIEVQPANGAEGDLIVCEVEEHQAARVEVQGQKEEQPNVKSQWKRKTMFVKRGPAGPAASAAPASSFGPSAARLS